MEQYIHYEDVINIYYNISTENIKYIANLKNKNITNLENIQNVKTIQWSPTQNEIYKNFELNIDGITENKKIYIINKNDIDLSDFSVIQTKDSHDYNWFEDRFEAQARKNDWSDGSVRIGTMEKVDLTNVNKIVWDHEFEIPDGGIGLWLGIHNELQENEIVPDWPDENAYIKYWDRTTDLERTKDKLDVSDRTGEWYLSVRFRSHGNATGTTSSTNWIYWTIYDIIFS